MQVEKKALALSPNDDCAPSHKCVELSTLLARVSSGAFEAGDGCGFRGTQVIVI